MSALIATAPHAASWEASIALGLARSANRTVLAHRRHSGPLQVQKALYPEGPEICHIAVLHPPGGIAGGDRLQIDADLAAGAHAVLTNPGATKWYRSAAGGAAQHLRCSLEGDAVLEWLPRENILFDGCQAAMSWDVRLSAQARFLGWEILCFGRRACGEQWRSGQLRLQTRIRQGGRTLWSERAAVAADGGFAASPLGLAGFGVSATFVAAGFELEAGLLHSCRGMSVADRECRTGVTWPSGVLIARYLGNSSQGAFGWFTALWSLLRPALLGRAAQAPRVWAC